MITIVRWVLLMTGPHPYPMEEFDTHAQCTKALSDYRQPPPRPSRNSNLQPRIVCRDRYITVKANSIRR
jgi:hypothetical protein